MGLSLWLVPPPNEFDVLQQVLDDLAKHGNGPAFQPHVTLVSVPISTPLPFPPLHFDHFPPMTLEFLDVRTGPTFTQSVLIAVKPNPELQNLHDSMRKSLRVPLPPGGSYFPHLSLFYGGDQDRKESLVRRLYEQGSAVRVSHEAAGGVEVASLSKVQVGDVWLVRTEGPVEKWEIMEKWKLGDSLK